MAKFRNGNLILTSTQEIIQGGNTIIDNTRAGSFASIAIEAFPSTIIDEFSTDGTLVGNSDTALPTEQAVKTYVDNKISGSISASVDNALARYDGTDGIQGSGIDIDDLDNISGVANIDSTGNITATGTIFADSWVAAGNNTDFVSLDPSGGIEIGNSGAAGFIDFKSGVAEDFDCRIIQDTNGLRFYTGGNGATANALTINSAQNIIVTNNLTIQGTNKSAGYLYAGTTDPTNTTRLNYDGEMYATSFINAVWNDVADFQELADEYVPGKCYYDTLEGAKICRERCQKSVIGILSDTYGMALGIESDKNKAPFAVAGWVLAYVEGYPEPGDPLTNNEYGFLVVMREAEKALYPERIVAIYKRPEPQEYWGTEEKKIHVNGRHWVKVK